MKYRGKMCKSCGKMQTGGQAPTQNDYPDYESWQAAMDDWMAQMRQPDSPEIKIDMPLVRQEDVMGPPPEVMQPTKQLNSLQDAISKGVVEAPKGWDSPEQYYTHVNSPSTKKSPATPSNWKQNLGIGAMAVNSLVGEISGRVARSRQNQYDYTQQTALGMMNPMPTSDYQPNPYSLYAKYGGKLQRGGSAIKYIPPSHISSTAIKNVIPGDMSQHVMLNDNMQEHGFDRVIKEEYLPPTKDGFGVRGYDTGKLYGQPGDSLTDNQVIAALRQYQDLSSQPGTPSGLVRNKNSSVWGWKQQLYNRFPLRMGEDYMGRNMYYMPSEKDSAKIANAKVPGWESIPFVDRLAPESDKIPAPKTKKYGGLQHVNYFGPPFSNGAKMDMSDGEKIDKKVTGHIIDRMFRGKKQGGGQLQKWETMDKKGDIYTDIDELPLKNKSALSEDKQWLQNWIGGRETQAQDLAKWASQRERDKHWGATNWLADRTGSMMWQSDVYKNPVKSANKTIDLAKENVSTIRVADDSKVNPNSYIDSAYGEYSPSTHRVFFATEPSKETIAHELTHGSKLANWRASSDYMDFIRSNDQKYKSYKDNDKGYLGSNQEIYSRIMGLRRGLDLKPDEPINKDILKEKMQNKPFLDTQELFNYLDEDSIIKLLNNLVKTDTNKNPIAKKGGLTPNKAREILHDGTAQGHPLTDRQRRYFGAMSKGNTMNYRGKK